MKINAVKCGKCGDIVYSRAPHDFRWCSCGTCAVDGGLNYSRIIGNKKDWEQLSISVLDDEPDETVGKILYDDWNYNLNKYGIIKKDNL